jgi:hypothetical protein
MDRSCLKNLLLILMLFGAVSLSPYTASGQVRHAEAAQGMGESSSSAAVAKIDTEAQTVTNSITIRTGLGVAMEMSSPLKVSCERMSALEKVGQGKPAEVASNAGEQGGGSGGVGSALTTAGKADQADGSQLSIPSHGRVLTLTVAEGHVAVSCNDVTGSDAGPPSQ